MNEKAIKTLQDPTIQKIASKLDDSIPKEYRKEYQAMLAAGMELMFNEKTQRFISERAELLTGGPQDMPDMVKWAILVTQTVRDAAGGKLDEHIIWQGTLMLALHGLDYFDRVKKIEVDDHFMAIFTKKLSAALLKFMGISKEQVSQSIKDGRDEMMQTQQSKQPQPAQGLLSQPSGEV